MANIEIGGRLHSTATGNVVTGANEVLDDTKNKKQSVINAEVDETIGDDNTAGTIKGRIKTAEGKLDTLNGDSSTSGSVAKAIADTKTELIGGATSDGNTLKKVEDRTATLETAVGSNGSVDQRIAAAKSEVIGDAASDYNTLGKLEDKIQAEASARESAISAEAQARQDAITAETNRATTRENQIYDLVHTPEQHYVTVATYADLANIASPSDDTIYRVSSYNGKTSQVDNTVYSEYGYNGTNFVFLCAKSQIDEVYDISAHHSNNTYVDLAAALDGGNNIPQELRKGGMSVKYVQSSDNKYVQYRLMSDSFNTTEANWQGVDDKPTAGSDNLVKSGGVYPAYSEVMGVDDSYNIGTVNTNIGVFTKITDIYIRKGDKYKVRLTGSGSLERFLLVANNYQSYDNVIQDWCAFDTWYEKVANQDIEKIGYLTGNNPNATNVVLEVVKTSAIDSILENEGNIKKNKDGIFVLSCAFDCHGFVKNCYVDASKINPLTTYAITNICKNHSEYGTKIYINGTIQSTNISNLNDIVKVGDFYLIVDWSVIPDGYNYHTGTGIVLNNDTIISKVLNEEILLRYEFDDLKSNIFTEPSQTTIGTINTNIGSFAKITDVNIKTGDTFKFRITGDGDIARFLLTCNNGTAMANRLQDYCQFDTWYEITAPFDLTSLGYQTGNNPNATNVVFELFYDNGSSLESKVDNNTNTLECDVLGYIESYIGTINTNIGVFRKILDINIKEGDSFRFRITGQGNIARFLLTCNDVYTFANRIKDNCELNTWYEFTATQDITDIGYQTANSPNATNVNFELQLLDTSLQGRIIRLENKVLVENNAVLPSKLYLTNKKTDLFFSPLFANWQFINDKHCRIETMGATIYRHFRDLVTINPTANGVITFKTYDNKYDVIASKTVSTVVTPQSKTGNAKCMFIGSSITAHGIYENRLKTMCGEGFECIGTRHAQGFPNEYFEAVGGWGFTKFASYEIRKDRATSPFWHPAAGRYWGVVGFWKDVMTYNEWDNTNPNNYVQSGRKTTAIEAGFSNDGYITNSQGRLNTNDIMYDDTNSHFVQWNGSAWNQITEPTNWGFDFVKYSNMWNINAPDVFVMAELSTNDFRNAATTPDFRTWNSNAEAMFTALKVWKNDINIVMLIPISTFGLTCVEGSEFFERSNYRMYQSRVNQIKNFDNREDENIYLIDDAIFFDEEYGFALSTDNDMTKPNQEYVGDEKLRVQVNSPHPDAQGEYLLADGMFGIIQYLRS